MNRTLDYVPRLVEANRAYRVTAANPALLRRSRYWTGGVVLDQGQEGSCVGHGVVGEWLASPVRGRLFSPTVPVSLEMGGPTAVAAGHNLAVSVYNRAKEIDEFEGDDTEGTSVRAGMLVARERGWCTGFRWAFNMTELRAALEEGPVVIGVEWREGMYDTDEDGFVKVSGPVVGGHCLLVTGYSPDYRGFGRYFRWRNSWGSAYGKNGNGYLHPDQLDEVLFQAGGEAAVVSGRHL